MKNYVGRKIRGFKFEDARNNVLWFGYMEKYIGEIGEITYENSVRVRVKFKDIAFDYPISLIEPHLIEETPEIPQLGEGVFMQVSNFGGTWYERRISAKTPNGYYVGENKLWKLARPIPQLPKYTHAELVEKLGHDFEIIE
jgi:hypothetical protein